MSSVATQFFTAPDGVRLAWHEMGEGRPIVLIHGLFSNADMNWIRFGHAAKLAAIGYRVIMPDLRAHGRSDAPHDPACYPPDILADDGTALIRQLGLAEFDLGGYSLGGRTTARMILRGVRPARAVIAGMGLAGLVGTSGRADHFRRILSNPGSFARGTPEWNAEAFLKTTGGDRQALLHVLSTFTDTDRTALRAIDMPVLVLSGVEDHDNGSAAELAALLPRASLVEVPGGHMSAVVKPELGDALAAWLGPA